MNVLQINNYHNLRGGSERVFLETAKLLTQKGHVVKYFSKTENNEEVEFNNNLILKRSNYSSKNVFSRIIHTPQFIWSIYNAKSLDDYLSKNKFDIAHLHIFYGELSNSILPILKKHKIPTVMSVHEYRMICPVYTFINGKGEICEKCKGKLYYNAIRYRCNKNNLLYSIISAAETTFRDFFTPYEKYIDHFIMVSNFIREKHIQYKPHIEKKSSVIYNFVNLNEYNFSQTSKSYLFYFGRLSSEKGIITLIEALKFYPSMILKIAGSGPDEQLIKDYLEKENLTNIELLGFKSGEELKELISFAKFTVVPSEWYENNPMTVIESLSSGTPVIGANIGGIPEIVIENKTGFIFDSGNVESLIRTINKAINIDSLDYSLLRQNARNFAEATFYSENHYKKLIKVYENVLK